MFSFLVLWYCLDEVVVKVEPGLEDVLLWRSVCVMWMSLQARQLKMAQLKGE